MSECEVCLRAATITVITVRYTFYTRHAQPSAKPYQAFGASAGGFFLPGYGSEEWCR